uniref:hypothetical protein n=1 Tax=Roseivirga sp. TaxID=1964215 RepID=UPI004048B4E2
MVDLVIDTTLPVTLTLPKKQNKLKIEACPCFVDFIINKFDLKRTQKEYPLIGIQAKKEASIERFPFPLIDTIIFPFGTNSYKLALI